MGDALVVANVPEEAFMLEGLCDYANGKTVRLADLYRNERKLFRFGKGRAELLRRHPNAFYQLPIRRNEIWEPPEEPTKKYGYGWHKNRDARREHTAALRASLERFLNEHLRELNHMLRTGWWVLGKVRVRVVECRPVPEREMRAFAKAIRDVESPVASRRKPRARESRRSD